MQVTSQVQGRVLPVHQAPPSHQRHLRPALPATDGTCSVATVSLSLIRAELAPMLRVAMPVVLAELGWMAMGVVDTIMVGPLGPQRSRRRASATRCTSRLRSSGWGCCWGSTRSCHRRSARAGSTSAIAGSRTARWPRADADAAARSLTSWRDLRSRFRRWASTPTCSRSSSDYFGVVLLELAIAAAALRRVPALPAGHPRRRRR